jgi:mycofactocin biosynthetic radical S-adenosylmethionine protein MftC
MNYAEWPLSAPVNLTWEITHHCNLSCIHCLSGSRSELPGELDLDQCRLVVDQLSGLKVFEISFGGGEPWLKSFFLTLLDYIHTKGIVTCISTNGTLLDEKIVSFLAGNPLVHIQVSLDGATPGVNDAIRGSGTYPRILKGIDLLARREVPFSLNTVVTALNYGQLDALKALAAGYGASLRVSRFRPSGRARDSWERLRLTTSQLEELSGWLGQHPGILTGDSFFSISGKGRRELGLDMCGACKMTCCIDPVGAVYPCAFLQAEEFYAGNLKSSEFKAIWDSSPVFLRFRQLEPASCRRCPRFSVCRGGCPAVAYFVSRDLNSADPECLAQWDKKVNSYDRTI